MTDAPGWDAIDAALAPLYPGVEPRHFGTMIKYALGGPDPLDGISAYPRREPVPHWHIVTYGMSELYEKRSDNPDESGWGFEFTFRLVRDPVENDPPIWALNFLQNLARYGYDSGNWFDAGHHIDLNGPIAAEREDTAIRTAAFAVDPELGRIATPHGALTFLQVVGLTTDEYEAAQTWRTSGLLDLLGARLPLLVTDLDRPSLLADRELAGAMRAGVAQDGSSTGHLYVNVARAETHQQTTTVTFGALTIDRILTMLQGRLPFGNPLVVAGSGGTVTFAPAQSYAVRHEPDQTVVELPRAAVAELARTVSPIAGTYRLPSLPNLVIRVERSEVTDPSGNVVRTVGA